MGRQAFPHCKAPDCTAERYTWPNGTRAVYCPEHLRLRSTKQRDGLPSMSGDMRRILLDLRQYRELGWPFVKLNPTHYNGRSIAALMERDWVFVSKGTDGERVCITGRGLEALEIYLPVRNRKDGICPRCNASPRGVRSNGRIMAYCIDCERKYHRTKQNRLRRQPEYTERLCCRCHKHRRHRSAGGLGSSCCTQCERERAKARRDRQRKQDVENAAKGIVKPCAKCGLYPRKVFEHSVSRYCKYCLPAAIRRWKLSHAFKKKVAKNA